MPITDTRHELSFGPPERIANGNMKTRIEQYPRVHGQLDTMHTVPYTYSHTMHTRVRPEQCWWKTIPQIPGANWLSYDTIIVHDPTAGIIKKHVLSWRWHPSFVRFGSNSIRWHHTIPCNAVPPDRGCLINPTLKPVFRSAETGEAERLWERQNSLKVKILSRIKVRWETNGFLMIADYNEYTGSLLRATV
jgi:hypothetical protein